MTKAGHSQVDQQKVSELLAWMADGGRPNTGARTIVDRICIQLCEAGVPIDRFALYIFIIHPNIGGRRFMWEKDGLTQMDHASHDVISSPMVQKSPAVSVMNSGTALRQKLTDDFDPLGSEDYWELKQQGLTDALLQPLPFTTGGTHAASWATSAKDGFSDAHIDVFERVRPLLARLTEIYILRLNAASLLNAYVGRDGGERVLAGYIERGDTEVIEAAVLFADFKNFTRLSTQVDSAVVIETLNRFFDILVGAIEEEGGDVLKFMGDGVLATFSLKADNNDKAIVEAVGRAVSAAGHALQQANLAEPDRPHMAFRAAMCLGDVHFGNIGGGGRLDFTAIGPSVNLAARLLSVASRSGHDVVCSAEIATHFGDASLLGDFELKGIAAPQPVYSVPLTLAKTEP